MNAGVDLPWKRGNRATLALLSGVGCPLSGIVVLGCISIYFGFLTIEHLFADVVSSEDSASFRKASSIFCVYGNVPTPHVRDLLS